LPLVSASAKLPPPKIPKLAIKAQSAPAAILFFMFIIYFIFNFSDWHGNWNYFAFANSLYNIFCFQINKTISQQIDLPQRLIADKRKP